MSIRINLEIGHEASIRNKRTPEGFTHDWEVFVRGCDNSEIHHYVEKVVFYLHETFPKPRRVVREPPYSVKESGYAGFNFPIEIYLRNRDEPKRIKFNYDLHLQNSGPPIIKVQKEKYVFSLPNDEFKHKLLKGGGSAVSPHETVERTAAVEDKKELLNKPKLSGCDVKKHKIKPEEARNSTSFQDLFGTPITKTSKIISDNKVIPKDVNKISASKSEKDKDKSKSKHSPNKDKDREREKSKEKVDSEKKHKEEKKKEKERNKEREKGSKEKTSKREKSPKPHSPSPKRSPKRLGSPKRIQSPPKHKEKEEKKVDSKEKDQRKSEEKIEKKQKKEKKEREHKDSKHKDRDSQKSEHKEHKSKETKPKELIKEPSPPKIEKKEKMKEEPKDPDLNPDKDKPKTEKEEKQKHKHKKKEKDRKEKKDEKDKSYKSEKKMEKVKEASQEKTSLFDSPKQDSDRTKTPKPLNTLFSAIAVNDSSNSSLSSTENLFTEDQPKIEEKKEPFETKKPKLEQDTSKTKKDKSKKSKEKKIDKEGEKKRKRKSEPSDEEPIEKVVKEESNSFEHSEPEANSNPIVVKEEADNKENKENPEDYMNILRDLQHKIMTLQDNTELQKVVQLIAETGRYEVSARTFDFDLCLLERSTVQQLQEFFARSS